MRDRLLVANESGACTIDTSHADQPDFERWKQAVISKIRAEPLHKPLSWSVQNDLIGIPIGEAEWIRLDRDFGERKQQKVDSLLKPLQHLLHKLEHCVPDCCSLAAYSFFPDDVCEAADELGRTSVADCLDAAIMDLDAIDPKYTVVISETMNSRMQRSELLELLAAR